jgi:hypothetical protein
MADDHINGLLGIGFRASSTATSALFTKPAQTSAAISTQVAVGKHSLCSRQSSKASKAGFLYKIGTKDFSMKSEQD